MIASTNDLFKDGLQHPHLREQLIPLTTDLSKQTVRFLG